MPKNVKAKSVNRKTLEVAPEVGIFSAETYGKLHNFHFAFYGVVKRILDLIFAILLLAVLAPIFLIIAIMIKIDSPGPVLFKQERVGKHGKVFKILKFRSMVSDNDMRDTSCEDRCTKIGAILRRTSLDELPQLLNVIMGQMSFVGPRPWVVEYWTNMNEEERERGRVLPGITGLAQVKGRNGISIFQKIEYDLTYVANYSLKQDIKVIMMTVATIMSGADVDAGKEGVMNDVQNLRRG